MAKILVLTQRIPYPPNKGEKIRVFQFIKHWCLDNELHLGCFVDDDNDWQYVKTLEKICQTSCFTGLNKKTSYLRMLRGLIRGESLSTAFFYSGKFQKWVDETIEKVKPDIIIIFSSAMAQYIVGQRGIPGIKIMDFVDVDSDKWAQYAKKSRFPMSWVYAREARKLLEFDRMVARETDASVFVTRNEVDLFNRLAPENQGKSHAIPNGVDLDYFDQRHQFENPSEEDCSYLVFTGIMDYKPNMDAVTWMVNHVLPLVWQKNPDVFFYIVGSSPSDKVKALGKHDRVVVTGRVPDVRPFVSHAIAAVAPLRIARGIQNKVLEAMAMGKITIVTPFALEGIEAEPGEELLLARDEQSFASHIFHILEGTLSVDIAKQARDCVEEKYSWQSRFEQYDKLFTLINKVKQ
ncbi:MAG: sugar transferase [Alphaproteobacteria bacterium]|nr:MAG: sugar transferase [Alphaproteobacteria bacterium]